MNNQEAINHIRYSLIEGNYPLPKEVGIEVLELAIKALKAVNLLDDLLVIERDGIYRPIKNTTKEECYKAIYEMSKIMADRE